jgi:hypothetical protein
VNEVYLQPVVGVGPYRPQQGGQRSFQRRDSGENSGSSTWKRDGCYLCRDPTHRQWNCQKKKEFDDFCAKKEQTNRKPAHGVNVVELELCPSETDPVEVALTRAQRAKARQLLTEVEVTEREPRHTKTKQYWEKEEAISNSMFEAIKQIQDQEDRARQALA